LKDENITYKTEIQIYKFHTCITSLFINNYFENYNKFGLLYY